MKRKCKRRLLFQVPVHRPEAPGWARFSSPSVADYSTPLARSPRPALTAHCSPATRRPFSNTASSLGSLQSTSLVYDTSGSRSRVVTAVAPPNRHHFTPGRSAPPTSAAPPPRYTHCDNGRNRLPPPPPLYPDYEYTAPGGSGEASPYSVSSELYKHVLPPQYFPLSSSGGRTGSRGSVLV